MNFLQRERIFELLERNKLQADIVVVNGKLVNVHTGEIYNADVATCGPRIAIVADSVKDYIGDKTQVINANGKFLVPGMIDTHYHVAGTYLTMTNLAAALVARGTTAVASDFYEYGAVGGVEAIKSAIAEAGKTQLKILFNVPLLAYVQNDPFSNTGKVRSSDLMEMLDWESAVALCEVQPQTLSDPAVRALIEKTAKLGKTVVGHYVGFDEVGLASWESLGPSSDHESTQAKEAVEKIRRGIRIAIREGSAATDLFNVVRAITEYRLDPRRFMFCTDEIDALDLKYLGHMDYKIRKAVGLGLPPVSAIQMATINAAEYFRIDNELGSLVPGKVADIVIVNDISNFRADSVIANGILVAEGEKYLGKIETQVYPEFMKKTIKISSSCKPKDFAIGPKRVSSKKARVNLIIAKEGLLISDKKTVDLEVRNGEVMTDPMADILKVAVVDRHGQNKIGNAFISGFGLRSGAIAESFAPVPENIIAVGTNNEDIAFAVNRIRELQGGFVAAENGKLLAELHLPILGLMSEKPLDEVANEMQGVIDAAKKLGCQLKSPFLSLMFMEYPLIPTLKITEKGLVDVDKMSYIEVIIDEN